MKKSLFRRLLSYFIAYKFRILAGVLASIAASSLDSISAAGVGLLVKILSEIGILIREGKPINVPLKLDYINIEFTVTENKHIVYFALALLFIIILKAIFVYLREYLMKSSSQKMVMKIRADLFEKILKLPIKYFSNERTGGLISRTTNDVANIEYSLTSTISMAQNFLAAFVYTIALFLTSWKLSLLVVMVFPISALIIKGFGKKIRKISRNISLNISDITSFLQEKISGIKIVKTYVREEYEIKEFKKKNKESYKFKMKSVRLTALQKPINEVFSSLSMMLVVLFLSYEFVSGSMSIDLMTRFVLLVTLAYQPIRSLGDANAVLQSALASAQRIFEIIDEEEEKSEAVIKDASFVKGKIEFKDVCFSYGDNSFGISNINLKIDAGKTLALVGPSGGGKTTIVNLIPRFYEIDSGEILIDNVNIKDIELKTLRSVIGIVQQETILFASTVKENIRYGKLTATDEEIIKAAKLANAHNFIMELPKQYDTYIGELGSQLSGGQRQRIAIARAILIDPKILLLDEATSALDTESERLIQEALSRLMKNRTVIAIAHRLSTIQNADLIAVIDKGKVVQLGNHQSLLQEDGLYKKLCMMQFNMD